jgi:hypothetical protein
MANGTFPVNMSTPLGVVRLCIPDLTTDTGLSTGDYLFSDAAITALLGLYNQNVKRAAARAIEIIATDQALLTKVIRTDDLSVNGAVLADSLLKQAKSLREDADHDDAVAADDGFTTIFDAKPWYIAAMVDDEDDAIEAMSYEFPGYYSWL